MRKLQHLMALVVTGSLLTLSSCHPPKNDDIISRHDLPMSGSQEVPAKTTPAYGSFDVKYNKTTHMLNYTLRWYALTGIPTGAHIHGPAARGVNAGIKHDFFAPFPKVMSGTYTGSALVDGVALIEDSLLANKYYFNIHTPANPGGEIRGQIEF